MSKQVIVKPQGIVTEPNKVGQFPPGACLRMINGAIRSFGVIESVEKWTVFQSPLLTLAKPNGGAYTLTNERLSIFLVQEGTASQWALIIFDGRAGGGIYTQHLPADVASSLSDDARTGILVFRNRIVVCGSTRSFVLDLLVPEAAFISIGTWRPAGVRQPVVVGRTSVFTAASTTDTGVLPKNTHLSAVAQNRMIASDKYELLSPPSFPIDYANLSTTNAVTNWSWTVRPSAIVSVSNNFSLLNMEVFRSRAQSVGYDSGTNKYSPTAVGSSYYRSSVFNDQSNNSSSFQYGMSERLFENALGEALLTNTAAAGAAAIPLPPPSAKCASAFKGYAFYSNRFDPALITIQNPYYWGFIPSSASISIKSFGIGSRSYSAQTATSASATVTGFPDTLGVKAGQLFFIFKTSDGTGVGTGTVVSTTGTTVTFSSTSSFSGSVSTEIDDIIELNGTVFNAGFGASGLYNQMAPVIGADFDIYAVALEPQSADLPAGFYPDYVPTGGITIRARTSSDFTIRATNPDNYQPFLASAPPTLPLTVKGKPQENATCWSENNQPEYVPPANYTFIGQGEIYQTVTTRDGLWFFCSDGLFRLSGAGGSVGDGYDWAVDTIDNTLILSSPKAVCVHRDYIYAYTNRGFVSISSEGTVRELSDGRINWSTFGSTTDLSNIPTMQNLPWRTPGTLASSDFAIWLVADRSVDDILIRVPVFPEDGGGIDIRGAYLWAYNTKTDTFVERQPTGYVMSDMIAATYNAYRQYVIILSKAGTKGELVRATVGANSFQPTYEDIDMALQPIYGATSAASAYTQKHWQDVSVSIKTPAQSTITVQVGFGSSNVNGGARPVPATTIVNNLNPMAESSRVGFTVPRAAPALANALGMRIRIANSTAIAPVALEGLTVNYIDFSDQRVAR